MCLIIGVPGFGAYSPRKKMLVRLYNMEFVTIFDSFSMK